MLEGERMNHRGTEAQRKIDLELTNSGKEMAAKEHKRRKESDFEQEETKGTERNAARLWRGGE
jgi:hypothetical protein